MKNGKSSGSSGFQTSIDDDCLLTAVEVARFLNLKHAGTVYHMVSAKRIPYIRLSGRCVRFSRRALLEWIGSLTQKAERIP